MLTGTFKSLSDIPPNDRLHTIPRFHPENFSTNVKLVEALSRIAKSKDCSTPQLALSWVRSMSKREGLPEIIPIPGATTTERVLENAVEVPLSKEEMTEIDVVLAGNKVAGDRYPAQLMKYVNG